MIGKGCLIWTGLVLGSWMIVLAIGEAAVRVIEAIAA
jgi:hypothetical protein